MVLTFLLAFATPPCPPYSLIGEVYPEVVQRQCNHGHWTIIKIKNANYLALAILKNSKKSTLPRYLWAKYIIKVILPITKKLVGI